jgi:transcriptional regulator with XRE-family HTH domain
MFLHNHKHDLSLPSSGSEPWAIVDPMAGRPPNKPATDLGTRLAALRKAAGLSQAKLAESLGIPQRTLCFYERDARKLPSTLLPQLAAVLGVSIEQIIGVSAQNGRKRGPKSQLERQLEAVADLPRHEQRRILSVVQALIGQYYSGGPAIEPARPDKRR